MKGLIKGRNLVYKVDPKDIAFINAVFEWYHEVATVRTRDPKEGLIELWVAPDFYQDAMEAVNYLKGFVKKLEFVKEVGDDWWKE
ncbi:DUF4911 domain-containing protein [Thermovibrio sp.]